jgi:hypothetical protein
MAAWTWMRYSYCWHVSAADLDDKMEQWDNLPFSPAASMFVRSSGVASGNELTLDGEEFFVEAFAQDAEGVLHCVEVKWPKGVPYPEAEAVFWFQGRLLTYAPDHDPKGPFAVDATASRFHAASVAGLVVGAMGVLILGLYLRRWLRARKALASQPGQDMIA